MSESSYLASLVSPAGCAQYYYCVFTGDCSLIGLPDNSKTRDLLWNIAQVEVPSNLQRTVSSALRQRYGFGRLQSAVFLPGARFHQVYGFVPSYSDFIDFINDSNSYRSLIPDQEGTAFAQFLSNRYGKCILLGEEYLQKGNMESSDSAGTGQQLWSHIQTEPLEQTQILSKPLSEKGRGPRVWTGGDGHSSSSSGSSLFVSLFILILIILVVILFFLPHFSAGGILGVVCTILI